MRNSATGAIIKLAGLNYVNLIVDSGNSRRFAQNIQAPNDPSGFGFWIDVTTSVYTDSGYTTKSLIYEENIERYLVGERWNLSQGAGGGWVTVDDKKGKKGMAFIDYDKIGLLLEEKLAGHKVKPQKFNIDPILDGHEEIKSMIGSIPPPHPPIDLKAHTSIILDAVANHFKALKFPEFDPTPILARIDKIKIPEHPDLTPHFEGVKKELRDSIEEIKNAMPISEHKQFMDDLTGRLATWKKAEPKEEKKDPAIEQADRAKNLTL